MGDNPAGSLAEALAAFQSALPRVEKDNVGVIPGKDGKQGYKYEYADLADITAVALPLLGKVGLSWSTKPTVDAEGRFVLEYRLRHAAGEEDIGAYPLPDPTRTPPQQVGSAISYARRYALCSVTGIAPGGDDDDGAQAQHTSPQGWERRSQPADRGTPRQTERPAAESGPPPAVSDPAPQRPPEQADVSVERGKAWKAAQRLEMTQQEFASDFETSYSTDVMAGTAAQFTEYAGHLDDLASGRDTTDSQVPEGVSV